MKIAVTGGAGFIASQLCDALVAGGHELLVIDDLSSGVRAQVPASAQFVQADIRAPEAAAAIAAFAPEILNHHAAQIDVRKSLADIRNDADVNIGGMLNVVDAARRAGCKRVIFASSGGAIYDDRGALPADENALDAPASPYGVGKRCGELYLEAFRRSYGLHYVALRYANVYGPRQNALGEAGVVSIFATRCLRGEECSIFGDGGQTRDFVFVGDVVKANLLALTTEFYGFVNIGTGVETDVNRIHSVIAKAARSGRPPRYLPGRSGEARRSVLDANLAAKVLDWRAETGLEAGLTRTVEWFRANG